MKNSISTLLARLALQPSSYVVPQTQVAVRFETVAHEDRVQIIDALYRFGAGQDTGDRELFKSSFAQNARMDFTQPAARLGAAMPVLDGRDLIVETIMNATSKLDTTHTVTNPRVSVSGDKAMLWALVEAQHLPEADHGTHLMLKNIYTVSLVREQGQWVIQDLNIHNVWFHGEPAVLLPR